MRRDIVLERVYPHPQAKVWRAIASQELLSEWLMETDFQPYVGHRFTFRTKSAPGFDGIVHCEVIAVDEPHKLAYTWQASIMKKPTTVTWTLESVKDGTRLRLAHTGFEGLAGVGISFILGRGWHDLTRTALPRILDQLAKE